MTRTVTPAPAPRPGPDARPAISADAALRATVDVIVRPGTLRELIPAMLRIVGDALQARACAFLDVDLADIAYGRYWYADGDVYDADDMLQRDLVPHETLRQLVHGFLVPAAQLDGERARHRTRTVIIDHVAGSAVAEFDACACALHWHLELNIPIRILGESPGMLCIFRSATHPFSSDERALAETLAGQLSIALAARQLAETASEAAVAREREAEAERRMSVAWERERQSEARAEELRRANDALRLSVDKLAGLQSVDSVLDAVARAALEVAEADAGGYGLLARDGTMLDIHPLERVPGPHRFSATTPLQVALAGAAARWWQRLSDTEFCWWSEPDAQEMTDDALAWHAERGHRQLAHVPLRLHDQTIGFLGLCFLDNRRPTSARLEMIRVLASQATLALHVARLGEAAQQAALAQERERVAEERAELLQVVSALTRTLLGATDPMEQLPRVLARLGHATGADRACVLLQQPTADGVVHRVAAEWVADGFPAQTLSAAAVISNADVPAEVLSPLLRGDSMLVRIDDTDHPFMQAQRALGVIESGACGLFVDGEYVGAVTFDICRINARWNDAQVRAIEIAANGISAALQQQRTILRAADELAREQQSASAARADELVHANEVLRQSVERLHSLGSLDAVFDTFLSEAMRVTGASSGGIFERVGSTGTHFAVRTLQPGTNALRILSLDTVPLPDEGQESDPMGVLQEVIAGRAVVVAVDERLASRKPAAHRYHAANGHRIVWHFPFRAGGAVRGYLGLAFAETVLPPTVIETTIALSHQASVALEILQLSEAARHAAVADERNRLAREIHDTLAQCLTGVIMQLQAAGELAGPQPDVALACIGRAEALARTGLAEARRSVQTLRTDLGASLDLAAALTEIVQRTTTGTPIDALVEVHGERRLLPPDAALQVLRIGQEAFTNALRHAAPRRIRVGLEYAADQLVLSVRDDGRGFDVDAARLASGFGLMGMRQRAEQIGARLTVTSAPHAGTELALHLPLAPRLPEA